MQESRPRREIIKTHSDVSRTPLRCFKGRRDFVAARPLERAFAGGGGGGLQQKGISMKTVEIDIILMGF
jgi:hypothetical protein